MCLSADYYFLVEIQKLKPAKTTHHVHSYCFISPCKTLKRAATGPTGASGMWGVPRAL